MTGPHLVPTEKARAHLDAMPTVYAGLTRREKVLADLNFTIVEQARQIDAVLALHQPSEAGGFLPHADQHTTGFQPFCVGCWEAGGMDGAPSIEDCPTRKRLAP